MKTREAVAWLLVGLAVYIVASHWTAARTWWKYRNEIDQAAAVLETLNGAGVIR